MKKDNPEKVEVDKDSLESMAENIKKIADSLNESYGDIGQLNSDAVITLIRRKTQKGRVQVSRTDIQNVLWAIARLREEFIVSGKAK